MIPLFADVIDPLISISLATAWTSTLCNALAVPILTLPGIVMSMDPPTAETFVNSKRPLLFVDVNTISPDAAEAAATTCCESTESRMSMKIPLVAVCRLLIVSALTSSGLSVAAMPLPATIERVPMTMSGPFALSSTTPAPVIRFKVNACAGLIVSLIVILPPLFLPILITSASIRFNSSIDSSSETGFVLVPPRRMSSFNAACRVTPTVAEMSPDKSIRSAANVTEPPRVLISAPDGMLISVLFVPTPFASEVATVMSPLDTKIPAKVRFPAVVKSTFPAFPLPLAVNERLPVLTITVSVPVPVLLKINVPTEVVRLMPESAVASSVAAVMVPLPPMPPPASKVTALLVIVTSAANVMLPPAVSFKFTLSEVEIGFDTVIALVKPELVSVVSMNVVPLSIRLTSIGVKLNEPLVSVPRSIGLLVIKVTVLASIEPFSSTSPASIVRSPAVTSTTVTLPMAFRLTLPPPALIGVFTFKSSDSST